MSSPMKKRPKAGEVASPLDASYSERYYWLKAMVDHIPDFIYAKDLDGRFLFANDAIVQNNGLRDVAELIGTTDFDFLPAEAARSIGEIERRVAETGESHLGFEERAELGDTSRWLMMSRVPLRDASGRIMGVVGASRDITIRKHAERLMRVQSHLLEIIARGTHLSSFPEELAAILVEVKDGIYPAVMLPTDTDGFLRVMAAPGIAGDYHRQVTAAGLRPTGTCAEALNGYSTLLSGIFHQTMALEKSYATRCVCIPSPDGGTEGLLVIHAADDVDLSDLSEFLTIAATMTGIAVGRSRAESRIGFLAQHDALTGLANRSLFEQRLTEAVAAADAGQHQMVLAFIDIDNFKLINDNLGHAAGDELLKIAANRITSETSGLGSVSRIGGDEFVVIFGTSDAEASLECLSRLRQAMGAPMVLNGMKLQVSCSIGLSSYPADGATAPDLLVSADMAMYRAKQSGRDCIRRFDASMAIDSRRKLSRTDELRHAIAHNEFRLHFQPQQDRTSGRIVGAEALIRWQHPTEGLIYPGDFIPLAEETGLIVPIGEWVAREACRINMAWQRRGHHPIRMSINVSARQFQEKGLVQSISAAITESGLDPANLEIEVTESMIMRDLDESIRKMNELTRLGISLAVDDFGTGYSSLSALKRFPLSRLKIDRSFIKDIPKDGDDMAITAAIISLAQKLGLDVIAEGVETEEQARVLAESGCNEIQGYLFSSPVSERDFEAMLDINDRLFAEPAMLAQIA